MVTKKCNLSGELTFLCWHDQYILSLSIFVIMIVELKRISQEILNSNNTQDEIATTHELGLFYKNIVNSSNITASSTEYTHVSGGVALSPQHAMDCLEDGVRTSRFLKGIYEALKTSTQLDNTKPVTILYAGCGPLATLLLPLLVHFEANQFKITLVDIHEESILSVKKIIEHIGLTNFDLEFKTCDATNYVHHSKIDLLITETMDKGLTNEPQVSISEHLCQYLSPQGILIPKRISLYSGRAVFSELPNHKSHLYEKNTAELIEYTHFLFSINRDSAISDQGFESEVFDYRKNADSNPDICIYTEIEIFDGIFLDAGDAQITDPICIVNPYSSELAEFKLIYTTKPQPMWKILQMAPKLSDAI